MHEEEDRDERCEEARGRVWITREASELWKKGWWRSAGVTVRG